MAYRKSWKGKSRKQEPLAPKPPDVSDLIGKTDLQNKNVKIYLIRMPAFLAEQFENPNNGVVGRLRIPDTTGLAAGSEHVENGGAPVAKGPKIFLDKKPRGFAGASGVTEYDVEMQASNPNIMVFSANRTGENDDVRVEGVVSEQCIARPKMDDSYRRMNLTRTRKANTTSRQLMRMDDKDRKAAERAALKPMSMTETAKQREERKRQKEDSRRHLDVPDEQWREIARVAVFKAFEIQSHYTADELARDIGEPTSRIRPIMSEVCAYNKSGPFAGKYELKDEFKTVSQRQQKERDLEDHRLQQLELVKKRREERAERERDGMPPSKKPRPS